MPLIVILSIVYGIYYAYNNYKLTTADCTSLQAESKTTECIQKGSQLGHSDKQAVLAAMYMEGEYMQQNYEESIKWTNKAAKSDNKIAQYILGVAYYNGFGVKKNNETALNW